MSAKRKSARLALTLLAFVVGLPAFADVEVHVVSVGQGRQTDDFYALPEINLLVDRPGSDLALVLIDGGEAHWRIETTQGTRISEVVRDGPDEAPARVTLSGIPMQIEEGPDLPLVFGPVGADFRAMLDTVGDRFGIDRIASFTALHKAGRAALRVDRVDRATAALSRDYLADHLADPRELPPALRGWIETPGETGGPDVRFDETGVTLSDPSGLRFLPITGEVPAILLPAASVYDPSSHTVFAVSYGGPGYLYAVDALMGAWRVIAGLNDYDASALLFDPATGQVVLTGAFSRPGDIRAFTLDGAMTSTFVPTIGFPGLSDLFDYGNEHGPPLVPHLLRDGWLLVSASAPSGPAYPDAGAFRLYAVSLRSGEVKLLAYEND